KCPGVSGIRSRILVEGCLNIRNRFSIYDVRLPAKVNSFFDSVVVRCVDVWQIPLKLNHVHTLDALLIISVYEKDLLDLSPIIQDEFLRADILESLIKSDPDRRKIR